MGTLIPASPPGSPILSAMRCDFPSLALTVDDDFEIGVVQHTGYVKTARLVPEDSISSSSSDYRTWTVIDPTTRVTSGDGKTTSGSPVISSATAAFTKDDIDKTITGTGIPSTTTITDVSSDGLSATLSANCTATATTIVFTIGASRTLATGGGASLAVTADTELDLTPSTTDVKVYKGDVLKLRSVHTGSTGAVDGGGVLQLEIVSYAEGTG